MFNSGIRYESQITPGIHSSYYCLMTLHAGWMESYLWKDKGDSD